MKFHHLFLVMDECGLASEAFAGRLGVAGMTIRRWRKESPKAELPKIYETALIDAIYQLIIEKRLDPDSAAIREVLAQVPSLSIEAALANMGISAKELVGERNDPEGLVSLLRKIGNDQRRRAQVDLASSSNTLKFFEKLGRTWVSRVRLLRRVLASTELSLTDKLVAYGALFYLITPFDLIPDTIPVVGYLDDYAVLVLAVGYYVKRFGRKLGEGAVPSH